MWDLHPCRGTVQVVKSEPMLKRVLAHAAAAARERTPPVDILFLLLRTVPTIVHRAWFRRALKKILRRICATSAFVFTRRKRIFCIRDLKDACTEENAPHHGWLRDRWQDIEQSLLDTSLKPRLEEDLPEPPCKKCRLTSEDVYVPLSQSTIWDQSASFYKRVGMQAWENGTVPYGISSSGVMAGYYADKLDYLYSTFVVDRSQPMYVLELGSGHMKLGYLVLTMLHRRYVERERSMGSRPSRFPFKFILCDVCEDIVINRSKAECFQRFVRAGFLDFSCWDCLSTSVNSVPLVCSGTMLKLKSVSSGLAVFTNYYFDSLPTDLYMWGDGGSNSHPLEIVVSKRNVSAFKKRSVDNLEARVSNPSLRKYIQSHRSPGKYFSVPVGAAQCVHNVKQLLSEGDVPLLWLYGDKVHSPDDDTVLRVRKNEFLPSLVKHGQSGCISVTIDNEMIGQAVLDGMSVQHTEHSGSTDAFQVSLAANRPFPPDGHRLSISDWESLSQYFIELCIDSGSTLEILNVLELSHYDFAVFEELQWDLAKKARAETDPTRLACIDAGRKCYENRYLLSKQAEFGACMTFTRWLYVLGASMEALQPLINALLCSDNGPLGAKEKKSIARLQAAVRRRRSLKS